MSHCASKGQNDVPVKQDVEERKELRGRNLISSLEAEEYNYFYFKSKVIH